MCGIFGYLGSKQALPFLIQGLKDLEYRGYDSVGLCMNNFQFFKSKGRIENHEKSIELKGSVGISHTRWATHGKPSSLNAHPHFDCHKEFAVVHNGIIENHDQLKRL